MSDEPDAADESADDATDGSAADLPERRAPAETSGSSTAEPAEPGPRRHPRRWFLVGAGALVLGAGSGVLAGALRHRPRRLPRRPPADLLAARAAEAHLLASVAAVGSAEPARRAQLSQLRRDHEAHLRVVDAALARYDPATPEARRRAAASAGAPARTAAALRAAETRAATAATTRAAGLAASTQHAALATVFASIAACESTHARLLP